MLVGMHRCITGTSSHAEVSLPLLLLIMFSRWNGQEDFLEAHAVFEILKQTENELSIAELMLVLLNEEREHASNELKSWVVSVAKVNRLFAAKDDNDLKCIVQEWKAQYVRENFDSNGNNVQPINAKIKCVNELQVSDIKAESHKPEPKEEKKPRVGNMFQTGVTKCNVTDQASAKRLNKKND